MNNYENQKKAIDLILQKNDSHIAVNRNTNKVLRCCELRCEECLLSRYNNNPHYCNVNRIKWLVSEYVEPEVDWSKVPVDTPVLISLDNKNWVRRYFAGVNEEDGNPRVFINGATRWSNEGDITVDTYFRYIKLAEME